MSRSPWIHKSRLDQDELELKSKIHRQAQSLAQLTSKKRPTPRVQELMDIIYEQFDLAVSKDGKIRRLPATDFNFLRDDYSPPTLIKAKRILGIKSVRREGFWFWTMPSQAPTEALDLFHKRKLEEMNYAQEQLNMLQQASTQTLAEIMTNCGLIAEGNIVFAEMEIRGYKRNTVLSKKQQLGITSKKLNGQWMWIWGNRTVQDWLENYLITGPQPIEKIMIDAYAESEWVREVVIEAMKNMRTVKYKYDARNKVSYWVNLNSPGEEPWVLEPVSEQPEPPKFLPHRESTPEEIAPRVKKRRVARVDFSPPEPILDPMDDDFELPEIEEENIGSVKIARFK